MRLHGVGKVERKPGRIVGPHTPMVQGTAVVCNIEDRQLEHNWYLHMCIRMLSNSFVDWLLKKTEGMLTTCRPHSPAA